MTLNLLGGNCSDPQTIFNVQMFCCGIIFARSAASLIDKLVRNNNPISNLTGYLLKKPTIYKFLTQTNK